MTTSRAFREEESSLLAGGLPRRFPAAGGPGAVAAVLLLALGACQQSQVEDDELAPADTGAVSQTPSAGVEPMPSATPDTMSPAATAPTPAEDPAAAADAPRAGEPEPLDTAAAAAGRAEDAPRMEAPPSAGAPSPAPAPGTPPAAPSSSPPSAPAPAPAPATAITPAPAPTTPAPAPATAAAADTPSGGGQGAGSLVAAPDVYAGWKTFHVYCYRCHGVDAIGGSLAPDLRNSVKGAVTHDIFVQTVTEGRLEKGMPSWKALLDPPQIEELYVYVIARSTGKLAAGRPKKAE